MKNTKLIAGILTALMLMTVTGTAGARPNQTVTTSLTFVDPGGAQGQLKAKFHATPTSTGTWSIQATFKPVHLEIFITWVGSWFDVHGTASATVTLPPGVPTQVVADGLYTGTPWGRFVVCIITVNANGVVSVQSITVA